MNKKRVHSPFPAVYSKLSKLRTRRRTWCFQEHFNANGTQLPKPGSENKPSWQIPQFFLTSFICWHCYNIGVFWTLWDLVGPLFRWCGLLSKHGKLFASGSRLWVLCLEALSVSACNWQHAWIRYTDDQEWQRYDREWDGLTNHTNSQLVRWTQSLSMHSTNDSARHSNSQHVRFRQSDLKYTAWRLVLVKA